MRIALGPLVGITYALAPNPSVNLLRFGVAIALFTSFVVWFGIGAASTALITVFAALFIVVLNHVDGRDDVPTEDDGDLRNRSFGS
jgi:ABC-type nitrate/sulfonate/bicarbonate transport system permease component